MLIQKSKIKNNIFITLADRISANKCVTYRMNMLYSMCKYYTTIYTWYISYSFFELWTEMRQVSLLPRPRKVNSRCRNNIKRSVARWWYLTARKIRECIDHRRRPNLIATNSMVSSKSSVQKSVKTRKTKIHRNIISFAQVRSSLCWCHFGTEAWYGISGMSFGKIFSGGSSGRWLFPTTSSIVIPFYEQYIIDHRKKHQPSFAWCK